MLSSQLSSVRSFLKLTVRTVGGVPAEPNSMFLAELPDPARLPVHATASMLACMVPGPKSSAQLLPRLDWRPSRLC